METKPEKYTTKSDIARSYDQPRPKSRVYI